MVSESTASIRTIIMPVDDSSHCERAFNWYIKRAHRAEDRLILVHVIAPKFISPPGGAVVDHAVVDTSKHMNEGVEAGKKILEKYVQRCKKEKFSYEVTLRADSNVGSLLISLANEYFANLIVIASQGTSKARRTFLGSVSQYVIHHSGVPVLVIPPAKRSSASFVAEVEQAEN